MIGVEENIKEESTNDDTKKIQYHPPEKVLPSLKVALGHARNQYNDLLTLDSNLNTKATIALSFSMAMIVFIASMEEVQLASIMIFGFAIFFSLTIIYPKRASIPKPAPNNYYKLAKYEEIKSMDLLLISYINVNEKMIENNQKSGVRLIIIFILIFLGIITYLMALQGVQFSLLGYPL